MCQEVTLFQVPVMEYRPNLFPELRKYGFLRFLLSYVIYSGRLILNVFTPTSNKIFERELRQHNTSQWHWPMIPHYSSKSARMQSFDTGPEFSKQNAKDLSAAGFFYTDKALQT